ncbi:TPA: hypothetical protein N0F65_012950 [Lagenidium giganteum]|uniref:Uncharacterized protein n=1 Tax=Lagenidium giganteum TaxID=4803 RepID=A0AAV2Z4Y3_9STRA|nr:TPA: hypothetical protein N0F65_012950 [Lagenidium giganteum]
MLRQANAIEPWKESGVMTAWDSIANTLQQLPQFGVRKDGKACHARFTLLIRHRRKNSTAALRRAGCDEEYEEKEQLLDDLIERIDAHATEVAAERTERIARNTRLENQVVCYVHDPR